MGNPKLSDHWATRRRLRALCRPLEPQVAPRVPAWLDVPPGRRWLDVGCGTGALCAAIVDRPRPASVTGVEPSEGFLQTRAASALGDRARASTQATRAAIPARRRGGRRRGLGAGAQLRARQRGGARRDGARGTAAAARSAAYVWDYAGQDGADAALLGRRGGARSGGGEHGRGRSLPALPARAARGALRGRRRCSASRSRAIDVPTRVPRLRRLLAAVPRRAGAGAGVRDVARTRPAGLASEIACGRRSLSRRTEPFRSSPAPGRSADRSLAADGVGSGEDCRVIALVCEMPSTVYAKVPLSALEKVSMALPTSVAATVPAQGTRLNGGPVVR